MDYLRLLEKNLAPLALWIGVGLLANHFFGVVGIGVELVIFALIQRLT